MKNTRYGAAVFLGAIAALAFGQNDKAPFKVSKETTAITAPLHVNGRPDYLAALNAMYGAGVTPENNGFVVWLNMVGTGDDVFPPTTRDQFLKLLGKKPVALGTAPWKSYEAFLKTEGVPDADADQAETEFDSLRNKLWKAEDQIRPAAYLKAQDALLDNAIAASKQPRWWIPSVSRDGTVISSLTTSYLLGTGHDVARTLEARATLKAAGGDIDGALDDLFAVKRLARQVATGPSLVGRLAGIAVDSSADDALGTIAGAGLLTQAQCKAFEARLTALPAFGSVAQCVDIDERWMLLDLVTLVATKEMNLSPASNGTLQAYFNGSAASFRQIDPAADWDAVLREVNAVYDQEVAAQNLPTLKALRQVDADFAKSADAWHDERVKAGGMAKSAGETQDAYAKRVARLFFSEFLPDLARADEVARRLALKDAMLHVLLAAAEVRAKTGQWPAALASLVPESLKELPHDIYPVAAPGELSYNVTAAGARIWSVGDAGKADGVGVPP